MSVKKISELKDGDVIPCKECGTLVTIHGIEETKAESAAIYGGEIDKLVIMCDDCFQDLTATHSINLDNQMN